LRALTVTGALLFLVSAASAGHLGESLGTCEPGWFAAAIAVYGTALVLGGFAVAFGLSADRSGGPCQRQLRAFRGHFFFVVLFGAAAGDVAKSAVMPAGTSFEWRKCWPPRRWIDFCFAGTTALALGVLFGYGEWRLSSTGEAPFCRPWVLALDTLGPNNFGALSACLVGAARGSSLEANHPDFRAGVLRLTRTPRLAANGFIFAFLAQSALSAVIALNLAAVTQSHWTGRGCLDLSVITIIGCVRLLSLAQGSRSSGIDVPRSLQRPPRRLRRRRASDVGDQV